VPASCLARKGLCGGGFPDSTAQAPSALGRGPSRRGLDVGMGSATALEASVLTAESGSGVPPERHGPQAAVFEIEPGCTPGV